MRTIKLTYDPELRDRFFTGELVKTWARKYPKAFDGPDVALVRTRLPYWRLFNEWFTAAHYAEQGYSVLIGKYQLHPEKVRRFREIAPPALVEALVDNPQVREVSRPRPVRLRRDIRRVVLRRDQEP